MFWRIICLITNKLDNCLILIIVGFILIWRNTWLFGYERVPVFALCTEKNNAGRLRCPQHFLSSKTFLNPSFLLVVCRKKKAYKLRWGMKAQKKSRQKEKVIPERGFKKRSLNLAEA